MAGKWIGDAPTAAEAGFANPDRDGFVYTVRFEIPDFSAISVIDKLSLRLPQESNIPL